MTNLTNMTDTLTQSQTAHLRQKVRLTISLANLERISAAIGEPQTPEDIELQHYLRGILIKLSTGSRQPTYAIEESTLVKRQAVTDILTYRANPDNHQLPPDRLLAALKLAVEQREATPEETNKYFSLALS